MPRRPTRAASGESGVVCALACAATSFLCYYPAYQQALGARASGCAGAGGGARRCACKQPVAPSGVPSEAGGGMCGAYAPLCARADADAAADGDVDEPLRAQAAEEHASVRDGFEYGTERGIGRRHGEAKCSERSDRRAGCGAPDTNCDYHERVESPRVWVTRTGDKACDRGARVTQEPRIILGVFASDNGSKVGVVSDGKLTTKNGHLAEPASDPGPAEEGSGKRGWSLLPLVLPAADC